MDQTLTRLLALKHLHVGVDLAVHLECLEGFQDGVVIISACKSRIGLTSSDIDIDGNHWNQALTTSHLLGEQDDHLGEVNGTGGLGEHGAGLAVGDGLADVAEGVLQVGGGEETVLVGVHDAEGFLELLDLPLGEEGEDVGAALLGLSVIKREKLIDAAIALKRVTRWWGFNANVCNFMHVLHTL